MVSEPSIKQNEADGIRGLSAAEASELNQALLSANSVARQAMQSRKRGQYFLKGPLSFEFIRRVIPDPTSRVVLIAKAFMDMAGETECVLSQKVWDCAGIGDKDQRRRVLARLRKMGPNLKVQDRKGRPSILTLNRD